MRWLRAVWRLLVELAKGPEGPSLEELADYGRRRMILRGLIALVVAPLVIGGMITYDRASKAWRTARSPCLALVSADDLARWTPDPLAPPRASGDASACHASWSVERDGITWPLLDITLRARSLPGPPRERVIERWDWERPERVVVAGDPRRPTARADLPDGRQLVVQTWAPDTVPLASVVTNAIDGLPPKP